MLIELLKVAGLFLLVLIGIALLIGWMVSRTPPESRP